jgi:hypothetical protein
MTKDETMDQDSHITELVRAADPRALRVAIAEVRAAYGVTETRAYAMLVRAAATGSGLPAADRHSELSPQALLAS